MLPRYHSSVPCGLAQDFHQVGRRHHARGGARDGCHTSEAFHQLNGASGATGLKIGTAREHEIERPPVGHVFTPQPPRSSPKECKKDGVLCRNASLRAMAEAAVEASRTSLARLWLCGLFVFRMC